VKMKRVSQSQWDKLAQFCAENAHERNFSSRRGAYPINVPAEPSIDVPAEPSEVLCVYNNNPYVAGPALRDDETARLRKRLKAAKIEELAYATYPAESGYTFAMILAIGEGQLPVVRDLVIEVTRESYERMRQKRIGRM
jgi:hypothetical protein